MTKQITTYTANVTGISANNLISSASEVTARQNTSTAINNTGEVVTENRALLEAIHTTDHIINVISTSFSGGTNQLAILADAITWWDESVYRADKTANASLTGWPAKTITGLTTSNTFYIWATFVSGTKDYEATNITAALPSNITEKALIGIATVSGAGAVTFAINWQGPTQTRENYFRDTQTFLGNLIIPTTSFSGATYTALITDNIIRYTGATTATLTLPTAVGNTNKEYLIINSSTTQLTYLTIDANASETINGSLTFTMQGANNDYVKIKSDGTNWYVIDQPPNSRTISDQTVSNVASVTFNNIGTYRDYELTIDAGPSTNGAALCLRTSTDNGSTYTATAGAYISQVFVATGGAIAAVTKTDGSAYLTDALVNTTIHGGVVRIVGALTSSEYTTMLSNFKVVTNPPAHSLAIVNSRREANEINNAFQVLATSGNITGRFILRGFN
jgi:hypothetical protein